MKFKFTVNLVLFQRSQQRELLNILEDCHHFVGCETTEQAEPIKRAFNQVILFQMSFFLLKQVIILVRELPIFIYVFSKLL